MLLRPRKFKFKNLQKKRSTFSFPRNSALLYGQVGLKILQPLRISSKLLFRVKILLKKGARRSDKTRRQVWLNAFPHLPLTKKVSGSRMGKGKGKLSGWYSFIPSGAVFIEYKNLRNGRASYFIRQLQHRLPVKSREIKSIRFSYNNAVVTNSKFVQHQSFL